MSHVSTTSPPADVHARSATIPPVFSADDIDDEPTPGRSTVRLYRRVRLDGVRYDGLVRYDPELERLVPDVREYIAAVLNRQSQRFGERAFVGRLYSPFDVPLPDADP